MSALTLYPTQQEWTCIKEQALVLLKSGMLPSSIRSPEQCISIMLKGRELKIPPFEALTSINVIKGKPTVSPQLMLALARKTKELEDLVIDYEDDDSCVLSITRKGQSPHKERFGPKEASDMHLIGKDNYKKQAKVMYKWRALSAALRVVFSDVITGMYTHEEMAPEIIVDEDGNIEKGEESKIPEQVTTNHALTQSKEVVVDTEDDLRMKIVNMLMEITKDDKEEAIALLEKVAGVQSTSELTGKNLQDVFDVISTLETEEKEKTNE